MADSFETEVPTPHHVGLVLRLGVFCFLGYAAWVFFGTILYAWLGLFPAAAVSVFLAGILSNGVAVRIYERGRLEQIGLGWTPSSQRHLLLGLACGSGVALAVTAVPLLIHLAAWERLADTSVTASPAKLGFVAVLLLLGASGEELLFRGYAFQVLMLRFPPWVVMVLTATLFALPHSRNPGANAMGMVNTVLWGIALGYAFYRSGDLWLPIGLHFAWNQTLGLMGTRVSGWDLPLTGHIIRWNIPELWSGGKYGPEGGLLATAAVGLVFLWLRATRIEHQPSLLVEARPAPATEPEA